MRGSQRIDDSHVASTLKVAQYAIYSFGSQNADGSTGQTTGTPEVWIDGAKITLGQVMPVGAGLHSVVISGTQGTKVDLSNLLWANDNPLMSPISSEFLFDPAKVAPHGLTALVRAGDNFDSVPQQIKIDPQVFSFYFQITLFPRPYTVEWTGKLYAPMAGTYTFSTEQLSKSRLLIDGKEVVVNSTPNNIMDGGITLEAGLHDIQLLFEDLDNFSHVYLYWQPPTIATTNISSRLYFSYHRWLVIRTRLPSAHGPQFAPGRRHDLGQIISQSICTSNTACSASRCGASTRTSAATSSQRYSISGSDHSAQSGNRWH